MTVEADVMYPGEVAKVFRVDPKTVSRWAEQDRFPALDDGRPGAFKTPGGHWRFHAAAVDALLKGESNDAA